MALVGFPRLSAYADDVGIGVGGFYYLGELLSDPARLGKKVHGFYECRIGRDDG